MASVGIYVDRQRLPFNTVRLIYEQLCYLKCDFSVYSDINNYVEGNHTYKVAFIGFYFDDSVDQKIKDTSDSSNCIFLITEELHMEYLPGFQKHNKNKYFLIIKFILFIKYNFLD